MNIASFNGGMLNFFFFFCRKERKRMKGEKTDNQDGSGTHTRKQTSDERVKVR